MAFDPLSVPVRFSRLKHMGRSPAHYRYAIEHGSPDSPAMRGGRIVHALLLGGIENLIVWDGSRRGKAWETFELEHEGEDIITASELDAGHRIAAAVREHEEAMRLLDGQHEVEIEWTIAGRQARARLDVLAHDYVTELKVTGDGQPEHFQRTALRLGYPAQLAWYMDGATLATGRAMKRAYIVEVESKPPHVVTPLRLTENAITYGLKTYRKWWEQLRVCEESGVFPGYLDGVGEFDVTPDVDLLIDGEEIAA